MNNDTTIYSPATSAPADTNNTDEAPVDGVVAPLIPQAEKEAAPAAVDATTAPRPSTILFNDCYLTLTSTHVIIKKYYFPFARPKKFSYSEIISVETAAQLKLGILDYKMWGMALNDIWWANGVQRATRPDGFEQRQFVFTVRGNSFRCGCSVETAEGAALVTKILRSEGIFCY